MTDRTGYVSVAETRQSGRQRYVRPGRPLGREHITSELSGRRILPDSAHFPRRGGSPCFGEIVQGRRVCPHVMTVLAGKTEKLRDIMVKRRERRIKRFSRDDYGSVDHKRHGFLHRDPLRLP